MWGKGEVPMSRIFIIEISEDYRIVAAVGSIDYGTHYFPQEQRDGRWNWLEEENGATVCFKSEARCRAFITWVSEGSQVEG